MSEPAAVTTFLQYRAADHEAGRAQPYVRDLVAWLEHEQLQGNIASLAALREMDIDGARFALAKSEALGEVLKRMFEPDAPADEAPAEEEFTDPATPPSERNKGR